MTVITHSRHVELEDVVRSTYRILLKRDPESDDVVHYWAQGCNSVEEFLYSVVGSEEYKSANTANDQSPFWHYTADFDARGLIRKMAAVNLKAVPERVVNFLGVIVDPKVFPSILSGRQGTVEEQPNPANWHADIAEWAAALRAVELSGKTFTMVELGCGWGCWMNNTGVSARRLGKAVHLIGVEGDPAHCVLARECLSTNGFTANEITLVQGIAAANSGVALFPKQSGEVHSWGLSPVFDATPEQRAAAAMTHDELPMIALADIVADHDRIDLLHLDIQGGEVDLVSGCLDALSKKFAYLVIGTHSRSIEGKLCDLLGNAGWALEIERPAINQLLNGKPQIIIDGVQGWRNPNLPPPS